MKIAVDIDDTLNVVERAKYAGAYIAREKLPYKLKDKDSNMFVNVYDWDLPAVLKFIRAGGVIAFTDAAVRAGARETLESWRSAGHEITVLTSRQPEWFSNPDRVSRDWLEKRRIPYDHLATDVQDKGRYCSEHGISVLVDDNVEHCLSAERRGVWAVLAVGKHNLARAREVAFGGGTWQEIARAVQRIAELRTKRDGT